MSANGTENQTDAWRRELERELKDNILGFWMRYSLDVENGGFIGEMSRDLQVVPNADKGLVLNARMLWTFACAYRIYGELAYLAMAERAYDTLHEVFRDEEHDGLYWTVDAYGRPVKTKKQVYGQAFVIYALAEYVRAKGQRSEAALSWAKKLYRLLEKHAYDPVHLGYVEALARDWQETDDLSLGADDLNERKSMNTHLHVMEAYTNLYRVWKSEGLRARLTELIDVHLNRILNPATYHFQLFFDDAWQVRSKEISYGHDIEGSWLLCEATDVLDDPERQARVRRVAAAMADAVLSEGVDGDGGVLHERDDNGRLDDAKEWWPQAEAMVGFLNAYQLTGDGKFRDAAQASWSFIQRFVVDHDYGEWHFRVNRSGEPIPGYLKISPWKCPYHNSRACFEMIERLAQLTAKAGVGDV